MKPNAMIAFPVAVLAGCALGAPSVPVIGDDSDLAILEGEWSGEFESVETGRRGRIFFVFDRENDSALGHVLMLLDDAVSAPQPGRAQHAHQYIDFSFIHIAGDEVTGTLSTYQDPLCGCQLETTFRGTLRAGVIRGRFTSVHLDSGKIKEGEWWARRRRSQDSR